VKDLSFLIPVKNDAARLRRCLESIAGGTGGHSVEIVVADTGSTDESADVGRAAGARVLHLPGLRVSDLRNRAAAQARGNLLAFVDADHEISADWTAAAVDVMLAPDVGAAGALCEPPPHGTWVQRTYGALRGHTVGRREVTWLGSGNLVVRREAFERVSGFDPNLEAAEDVDLCRRLRAAGWRIVADGRMRSVHLGDPASLALLFRGERWRSRDNLRVALRGRLSLRDLPGAAYPMAGLAALLVAAGGLLGSALGTAPWWMAPAGAATFSGLSAIRGVRMIARDHLWRPGAMAQAFVVAVTYDAARAVALVSRAAHHREAQAPQFVDSARR
jgi:GT2 family glycosyltransferase